MDAPLDYQTTALLLLDFQVGFLQRLPQDSLVVDHAASALAIARRHGAQIAYVRAALDDTEINEVPDHSISFAVFKTNEDMRAAIHPDAKTTQIHPKLAPRVGDLLYRKIRFGPLMTGPSKAMLEDFTTKGIKTVVLGGITTSGVVLSTVRQLGDLNFRLIVLEDCCADHDAELHEMLCEKVLPRQAKVIKSSELDGLFGTAAT